MLRTTAKEEIARLKEEISDYEKNLLYLKKFKLDKVAEIYRLKYTSSTFEQSYKYAERKLKPEIKEIEVKIQLKKSQIEDYKNFLDILDHVLYKINYQEEEETSINSIEVTQVH